jgi:glycosyltransferase involved in cell wall biosynthesis
MGGVRVLAITGAADRPETGAFVGLHRAGVDLKVLLWPESAHLSWLRDAGVPYEFFKLNSKWDWQGIKAIRSHMQRHDSQVLYLLRKRAITNGIRAARGSDAKIVLYRGIVGNLSYGNPVDWMSFLNPRVDRIVCVADAVRRSLLELGGFGMRLQPERLTTIYKGHDLDWYREDAADLEEFGILPGAFVLSCVTNVRPRKGIPLFIDSLAALPVDPAVHILLVGKGMDSPSIGRRIAHSPHRDRIHVLGFRFEAPRLIAASDVLVLPSLRREGLPRSVIEAMAYETTPVVSDSGGNPELVEHECSGLVFPAGDVDALGRALLSLYDDRENCRRLGEQARLRIASDFRVESTVDRTLDLYNELVSAEGA